MRRRVWIAGVPLLLLAGCPQQSAPTPPAADQGAPAAPAAAVPEPPAAPAAPPPPSGGLFTATFESPGDFYDRFQTEVHHRDDWTYGPGLTWPGDHDAACNGPTTERVVHSDNADTEAFWWCAPGDDRTKGHIMMSMGDVSGYSVTSIAPNQVFPGRQVNQICWDINTTDLDGRQWMEFVLIPEHDYQSNRRRLAYVDPTFHEVDQTAIQYPAGTIAVKLTPTQTFGYTGPDNTGHNYFRTNVTGDKAAHVPMCLTQNRNGTVTFHENPAPGLDQEPDMTWNGQFPEAFRLLITAHTYTPLKDGPVDGFTWHLDNITVR